MIFPFSEHWIPWYQRLLFRWLGVFGSNRRLVRRFLGGRWERRIIGDPVHGEMWLPYLAANDPPWGLVRCRAIKVEEW